jgi:hypothetical protein
MLTKDVVTQGMLTEEILIWARMALDRQQLALNHAQLALNFFSLDANCPHRPLFEKLLAELLESNQSLKTLVMATVN